MTAVLPKWMRSTSHQADGVGDSFRSAHSGWRGVKILSRAKSIAKTGLSSDGHRSISFKAAPQTLEAFQPMIAM
jgi:hypothetical protein